MRTPPGLRLTLALLIGTMTSAAICPASAAETNAQGAAKEIAADPKVVELISKMSKFYAGMPGFSYMLSAAQSLKLPQTIESETTTYDIKVLKPLNLAVDATRGSSTDKKLGRLNENEIAIYIPKKGYVKQKAADVPAEVRVPAAITLLTAKLVAVFGLLDTISSKDPMHNLTTVKKMSLAQIKDAGSETIDGVATEHLKMIGAPESVGNPGSTIQEWDIWIEQGDKPWLRRTSTKLKGPKDNTELNVLNNFSDWKENPKFTTNTFAFVPPQGATEIKVAEEPSDDAASKLKGKAAPAIKLSTADGGTFDLADSKGKEVVVLDFWATWCPPCRRALPILAEVTSSYAGKGVRFCAIDLGEDAAKVKEFLKAQGLTVNAALDHDGAVAGTYGVNGIPQSVIVGKDGIIKAVHVGFAPDLKERLPKELDAVLAGQELSE